MKQAITMADRRCVAGSAGGAGAISRLDHHPPMRCAKA
jgi:hypothetical protein